jgi:drug/metabolite transporter (DMT)-like permease
MRITNRTKGVLAASMTAFLWGFLPIVLDVSLNKLSPVDVSWARFVIAFVTLFIYHILFKPKELKIMIRPPILIILAAICLGLNYLGLISGLHYTTPAIAEIFIQSGAIFLAIVGFLFFKEKASWYQLIGLGIVVIGLGLFYREQIIVLADHFDVFQKGVLLTLFGGSMWTCYAVMQRKLVAKWDPLALNLLLFGIPAMGYLPLVNFQAFASLNLVMWGVVLFLGVNTLIAYGGMSFALKYLPASRVSVIITLNPIITFSTIAILMALDVSWIAPEKFTFLSILGACGVVIGAVLTLWKKEKSK